MCELQRSNSTVAVYSYGIEGRDDWGQEAASITGAKLFQYDCFATWLFQKHLHLEINSKCLCHKCIFIYTHTCVHVYVYIYRYMHVYIYIYVHMQE